MSSVSFGSSNSGPSQQMMGVYGQEYSNALGFNLQNYNNILGQYASNQQQTAQGASDVNAGYGSLQAQVGRTIAGIGQSQQQAINDYYTQQAGGLNQSMISRGLGNTTVGSQLQRGVGLDQQKASIALSNQMAQLAAGYQSSLGSAGLQALMQGVGLRSQAGNVLGGNLAHSQFPFPHYPQNSTQGRNQSSSVSPGGYGGGGSRMRGDGTSGDWWAGQGGGGNYGSMNTPVNAGQMPLSYGGLPQQSGGGDQYLSGDSGGSPWSLMMGGIGGNGGGAEAPNEGSPYEAPPTQLPEGDSSISGDTGYGVAGGYYGY